MNWEEMTADVAPWLPPEDWFTKLYRLCFNLNGFWRVVGWACRAGFLYRTTSSWALPTYRWQWRFWRGPCWMFVVNGVICDECSAAHGNYHHYKCEFWKRDQVRG